MKTKYKYIHIEKNAHNYWDICNNSSGSLLGTIYFYKPWKDFVFTQAEANIIFSESCLLDIIDFIKQLREEQSKELKLL